MRALITGAAGFIGSHTYEHFISKNDDVVVVDKLTYAANHDFKKSIKNLVEIDVSDRDIFNTIKDFKPDVIINFAAETHVDNSIDDSYDFIISNTLGTSNLLDACRTFGVKLCQVSTDEVYGPASVLPFVEEDGLNPMNPYSASKAAADMMVKAYHNTHGIQYIIVRPSNNYGPRQHKEKLIPKLLDCVDSGNRFPLYGQGNQKREWTYVEDTSKIVREIILKEKSWCSTYNISSSIMHTNLEVISKVLKAYNKIMDTEVMLKDVIQVVPDRPGHDKKYWMSTIKLQQLVNVDYTDFQSGLEKTISSYVKKQ